MFETQAIPETLRLLAAISTRSFHSMNPGSRLPAGLNHLRVNCCQESNPRKCSFQTGHTSSD